MSLKSLETVSETVSETLDQLVAEGQMDPSTRALAAGLLGRLDIWASENGRNGGGIHPVEYNAITGKFVEFLALIDTCKNFNQGIENEGTQAYAVWCTKEALALLQITLNQKREEAAA